MKITDLSGIWRFQEDPQGNGIEDKWFHYILKDTIKIPGIMQAQGYGDDITHDTCWMSSLHDNMWYLREEYKGAQEDGVKVPFLSQPPKHYMGKAWYQREFEVSEETAGCYFRLFIECTKWNTKVWVDDEYVGGEMSLCAPHEFGLGILHAGEHRLTICVDNGFLMPYRPDGHGITDATGATWNGLVGKIELRAMPSVYLSNINIYPDYDTRKVEIKGIFNKTTSGEECIVLTVGEIQKKYRLKENRSEFVAELSYPWNSEAWDEYTPVLHTLEVKINGGFEEGTFEDSRTVRFGFRKLETFDNKFYINGKQAYFRGTHFGGEFPLNGYPSTEPEYWKRIFGICREWGLNFMRFHSYCPPEAAFEAADELGFYLQVECGMWNRFREDNDMLLVLKEETKRIIAGFGNHPSFVMLSPSNEPSGGWFKPLMEWVKFVRAYDGRRLYTMQSGWPFPCASEDITDNDYLYYHRSGKGPYTGGTIRGKAGWYGKDYRVSLEGVRQPVICHELGQWCSYPDFDIINKFNGHLRPGNFEVFEARAERKGLRHRNKELARASGKFQVQMYKEDLEANFRTPKVYGFELLDLHDYLGQGTALVGVLDAFWEEKGYITAEEFKNFCAPTVILLRMPKYVYTNDEKLEAFFELAHFAQEPLKECRVKWEVHGREKGLFKKGEFLLGQVNNGKNIFVGEMKFELADMPAPGAYDICARIDGTDIYNEWHFWLYEVENSIEKIAEDYKELVVFTRAYSEAVDALSNGRTVLYMPSLSVLDWNCPPIGPYSVVWNSQMGPKWSRSLGLLIDKEHPAFRSFPTEEYQEWQWEPVVRCAKGFNLADFPIDFNPIVQPVDDWNRSYRLGLIWEAKAFGGKLLFVSADLKEASKLSSGAAAQLFKSLTEYAASEDFNPQFELEESMWERCFADTLSLKRYNVKAEFSGNAEITDEQTDALMACNPDKMFVVKDCGFPFEITLSWEKPMKVAGIKYMPGQFHRNHAGDICNYEIEALMGTQWINVARESCTTSFDLKLLPFSFPVETTKVRFRIISGFARDRYYAWHENVDGWNYEIIDYKDKDVVIGALGLVTEDDSWKYMTDNEISDIEVKTITVEIDD